MKNCARLLLVVEACLNVLLALANPQSASSLTPERMTTNSSVHHREASHHGSSSLDEVIYHEDWETGTFDGWTSFDLTAVQSTWHLDSWNAFCGSGTSWWVGDTTGGLNGYGNSQYFVLDSPPIQLPTTDPRLLFWHRYSCELPSDFGDFNGWDGMNLRISTNAGATWTVIPSSALSTPYSCTSLFSFGDEHSEGPGVPGWAGATSGWGSVTANLATWAGQTIKLRWAFASDPGFSTADNLGMFGWQVDNIRVYRMGTTDTVFADNCIAQGQWTTQSNVPVGGNLWRIAVDPTSPAGSHVLVCNSASTNLYNPNMRTVIESPLIDLRNYSSGSLHLDVYIKGEVPYCGEFPVCDYWGIEVSADSGRNWCMISNPECLDYVPNYIYVDCPIDWSSFVESYGLQVSLSPLIGHVLRFRYTFRSDAGPWSVAQGPVFDDFTLYYASDTEHPNCPGQGGTILASHKPYNGNESWIALISDSNYLAADSYFVNNSIGQVDFWGITGGPDPTSGQIPCVGNPMTFSISFHPDSARRPATAAACQYSLNLTGIPTAQTYSDANGVFPLYEYHAMLSPVCQLRSGWIVIRGFTDTQCYFLWARSYEGYGPAWVWQQSFWGQWPYHLAQCLVADCDSSIRAENVTVYIDFGGNYTRIRFAAPFAGEYKIYSTADKGVDYPHALWNLETTMDATTGVNQWVDTGELILYKRYVVIHNCP
jgi:hypothetical protein